jgi:hypothetical protein
VCPFANDPDGGKCTGCAENSHQSDENCDETLMRSDFLSTTLLLHSNILFAMKEQTSWSYNKNHPEETGHSCKKFMLREWFFE